LIVSCGREKMNKFLVVFAAVCAISCAKRCAVNVEEYTGEVYTYDLSHYGELFLADGGYNYTINMCDGVSSGCPSTAAVCMTDNDKSVSLGALSTRSAVPIGSEKPGEGVVVLFGSGDHCPDGYYTSSVIVLCDPSEDTPIITVLSDTCDYSFQVVSKYGCGTIARSSQSSQSSESSQSSQSDQSSQSSQSSPSSPSSHAGPSSQEPEPGSEEKAKLSTVEIVLIIVGCVLVVFIIYIIIGTIIMWRRSSDNRMGCLCLLPGLVADGCRFLRSRCCPKSEYVDV